MADPTPRSPDLDAAEAEKYRAEARKFTAEATKAEHDAAIRALELDKARRQREEDLAANKYYHVYRFDTGVDSKSVDSCMNQLEIWHRLDPTCEVTVVWDSPGGSVTDGLHLLDYLRDYSARGHRLTSKTMGVAASMAGILAVVVGDNRVMGREAVIMLHEPSFGAMGKLSDVVDRTTWVKATTKRIAKMIAARSKLSPTAVMRMMERKETWLDSDAALKHGLVDEVI